MARYILLIWCMLMLAFTCNEPSDNILENGILDVNFKTVFNGQPVQFDNVPVILNDDINVIFDHFHLYLTDGGLMSTSGGNTTEFFEVTVLDFSELKSLQQAEIGITLRDSHIPEGIYNGFRFHAGLSPSVNSTNPYEYFGNHPMARVDFYEPALNSYLFMRLKGRADTDQDDNFDDIEFDFYTALENGFTDNINFFEEIIIEKNQIAQLFYTIDLEKIFGEGSNYIDITKIQQTTHANVDSLSLILMRNLEKAITLVP